MSRKYLDQMIEEIEFTNYQRYLQASGSLSSFMYPEFCYPNRCDWMPRGCFTPPHWMFPHLSRSSCDSFNFLKRREQFGFHRSSRGGNSIFKDNECHQGRCINGKPDFFSHSGRRSFLNCVPTFCRFKSDGGRFQKRTPCYSEKPVDYFQRYKDERLESLENLKCNSRKASIENLQDSKRKSPVVTDDKAAETQTTSCNNLNIQLPETSTHKSSSEISNGYASWYHAEEQQQIVNMLKEVNMRHERQLRRDARIPCSDDSTCSNVERASYSSDDEDDGIVVLVSPEERPSPDVIDPDDEDKDLADDYLEKSVSDYFEEFQSIFTVSPEKNIINSLTKECLKECIKPQETTGEADLKDGEELQDRNKMADDAKSKETEKSLAAETEIENGICEKGIIPKSEQLEEKVLSLTNGRDTIAETDESQLSFSASPPSANGSEIQKCNKAVNGNDEAERHRYELNSRKRSEALKTEQNSTSLKVAERNDKSENISDRLSSQADIIKYVSQLRKKNFATSSRIKPHALNSNRSRSSYNQPETVYSFPNQTKVYIPNSLQLDNFIKRSTTNIKLKMDRQFQFLSGALSKPIERTFLNKYPCFIPQNEIPTYREAKSETCLLRNNASNFQSNIPITSLSDTHLPFNCKEVHYKKISVDELFQTVSQNKKDKTFQELTVKLVLAHHFLS